MYFIPAVPTPLFTLRCLLFSTSVNIDAKIFARFFLVSAEEAVKTKWKNLRDTFRKELKKIPDSLDDDVNLVSRYTGTWPHFEAMQFLQSVVTLKSADSNAVSFDSDFLPLDLVNADMKDGSGYDHDDPELLSISYESTAATATGDSMVARKRRLHSLEVSSYEENRKISVLEERLEDDEDLNFFKSLIPHVRHLPSLNKLHFRSQVQALLISEISKLQEKSCQENAPHSSSSSLMNPYSHSQSR